MLELGDPRSFLERAVTPPKAGPVMAAISNLMDLGALAKTATSPRPEITPLGFHLAHLPVDARLGKMLIFGSIFCCLDPVLTIAAVMSCKSPFVVPFGKEVILSPNRGSVHALFAIQRRPAVCHPT